jgi:hypothetical protein
VGIEDPFDDTDNTARCIGTSERNSNTSDYIGLVFHITATYMAAGCSGKASTGEGGRSSSSNGSSSSSSAGGYNGDGRNSGSGGNNACGTQPVDMVKLRMIYSWLFGPKGVLCLGHQAAYVLLGLPCQQYQQLMQHWSFLYQQSRGPGAGQQWLPVECYRNLLSMVEGPQDVPLNLQEWRSMMDQQRRQQLQEQAQQRLAQQAQQEGGQHVQGAAAAAGKQGVASRSGTGMAQQDLGGSAVASRSGALQQQESHQEQGSLGKIPILQQQQAALTAVHHALAGLPVQQQPLAGLSLQAQQPQLAQAIHHNIRYQQQQQQAHGAALLQSNLQQMQLEAKQAAQQQL